MMVGTSANEQNSHELLGMYVRLTSKENPGAEGSYHERDDDLENHFFRRLIELPHHSETPRILLAAIDRMYLSCTRNWQKQRLTGDYFNCFRVIELSDKIIDEYPGTNFVEDALWFKARCYHYRGGDTLFTEWKTWTEMDRRKFRAQVPKADFKKAEALLQRMLRDYPEGKWQASVKMLLHDGSLVKDGFIDKPCPASFEDSLTDEFESYWVVW